MDDHTFSPSTSSKSSLFQFLEEEEMKSQLSRSQRSHQDDASTKAKSITSRSTGKKSYIWDEIDSKPLQLGPNLSHFQFNYPQSPDSKCVFSELSEITTEAPRTTQSVSHLPFSPSGLKEENKFGSIRSVGGDSLPSSSSQLSGLLDEVRSRVVNLKKDLDAKNHQLSEAQVELARLQAARTKRIQKFENQWENKLENLRATHETEVEKLLLSQDKLCSEVKELEGKLQALKDKRVRCIRQQEEALEQFRQDAKKKRAKNLRQLEADERSSIEKTIQSKEAQLKRQAADGFGPTLEKLVQDNKEAARRKSAENDSKLEALRSNLFSEIEDKTSSSRLRLQEELKEAQERHIRKASAQIEDLTRRHADEISQLRDKHSRDKKALEDQASKTRRSDSDAFQEELSSALQLQTQRLKEVTELHEKESRRLSQSLSLEYQERKNKLDQDLESFLESLRSSLERQREREDEDRAQREDALFSTETSNILERVKSEMLEERRRSKQSIFQELEDLREEMQTKASLLTRGKEGCTDHTPSLREEIRQLQEERFARQAQLQTLNSELQQQNSLLASLQASLSDLTQRANSSESSLLAQLQDQRERRQKEIEEARSRVVALKRELRRNGERAETEAEELAREQEEEVGAVEEKISRLLSRKGAEVDSLAQELQETQEQSSYLQGELDKLREERLSGPTGASVLSGVEGLRNDALRAQKLNKTTTSKSSSSIPLTSQDRTSSISSTSSSSALNSSRRTTGLTSVRDQRAAQRDKDRTESKVSQEFRPEPSQSQPFRNRSSSNNNSNVKK